MKRAFVFDIDGTLSSPAHRLHHITGDKKDWSAFFAVCDQDAPIPHMIELAETLIEAGHWVLFATGRSDDVFAKTLDWLRYHIGLDISSLDLYMRAAGDHREDTVVKAELLDRIRANGYEPIMVFEDRASVVKMWRENGIPCAQIVDGNY